MLNAGYWVRKDTDCGELPTTEESFMTTHFACHSLARRGLAPSFVLLFVTLLAGTSEAQDRRNAANGPKAAPLHGSGTLVAARPGLLQVTAKDGAPWLLQVKAEPQKIHVSGTAHPNLLAPGMFVRFSAELNKKGEAVAPVDSLTVFTPRPEMGVGIALESSLDRGAFQFGEVETPADTTETPKYLVAGRIVKRKNNDLAVSDGRNTVKMSLAEKVEIKVDLTGDYRMIRPGDKVEYRGKYYQNGQGVVTDLKITGATPFGAPPEPATPRDQEKPVPQGEKK
jgi:hypothetical protein